MCGGGAGGRDGGGGEGTGGGGEGMAIGGGGDGNGGGGEGIGGGGEGNGGGGEGIGSGGETDGAGGGGEGIGGGGEGNGGGGEGTGDGDDGDGGGGEGIGGGAGCGGLCGGTAGGGRGWYAAISYSACASTAPRPLTGSHPSAAAKPSTQWQPPGAGQRLAPSVISTKLMLGDVPWCAYSVGLRLPSCGRPLLARTRLMRAAIAATIGVAAEVPLTK